MNIWLIGFMGSGKSTLGEALAHALEMKLIDTDNTIESTVGMSVASLWTKHGEGYFRILERQLGLILAKLDDCVIATGGGFSVHSLTIDEMKRSGKVVYMSAEVDVLWSRVLKDRETRPLALTKEQFASRLLERKNTYEQADVVLDATLTAAELIQQLQPYLLQV